MIYFKRFLENKLLAWKNANNRLPLVLNGARQVGKTHLMKWLGKTHFNQMAYFNFDERPELSQFFEQGKNAKEIIDNLSLVHGSKIEAGTLLIFDEIQACLPALGSLKYFAENMPNLHVISAGSLLGVSLGNGNSFPVGKVQFLDVHPLSFSEFLQEVDGGLHKYMDTMKKIEPIPDIFFNRLKDNFKKYLITGGLPAVAVAFIETHDFSAVDSILDDLLDAYQKDFAKHPIMKDSAKINHVWKSLPSQLARENKKFVYQLVKQGARAREYEDAIIWLEKAGLIHRVFLNKSPKLPLVAYDDLHAYKIYCFDVGLLRRMSRLDPVAFTEGNRLFMEFKGALIENYVLQSLNPQIDAEARYWTSDVKAEIDLIIQWKNEIIPIEVKSDENIKSRSLTLYHQQYKCPLRIRYSLKNLELKDGLLNIPHFMADHTNKLIELAFLHIFNPQPPSS